MFVLTEVFKKYSKCSVLMLQLWRSWRAVHLLITLRFLFDSFSFLEFLSLSVFLQVAPCSRSVW